jgi:hypothetical protein
MDYFSSKSNPKLSRSIEIILICRFHLDLIERHGQTGQTSTLQLHETPSLMNSVKVAVNQIGRNLDDDFGDHDAPHDGGEQSTDSEETHQTIPIDVDSIETT